MTLNDLKNSGQASSVIDNNISVDNGSIINHPLTVEEIPHDDIIVIDENSNKPVERKIVSIQDMIDVGAVKSDEQTSEEKLLNTEIGKVVAQVMAPDALDDSVARRRVLIEATEKENQEKELENELNEPDEIKTEDNTDEMNSESDDNYLDPDYNGEDDYLDDIIKPMREDTMETNNTVEYAKLVKPVAEDKNITTDIKETISETENKVLEENTPIDEIVKQPEEVKDLITSSTQISSGIDFEAELAKLDEEVVDDEDDIDKETVNKLKTLLNEKMSVNKHDLTGFTVIKKPVSLNNALSLTGDDVKTADWVLINTGVPITLKAFTGSELEVMNNASQSRNRSNAANDIYSKIYDHITSPKPTTFEAWLKSVSYFDIDHIFFAIYKACFNGVNYIPYTCSDTKCNEVFLSDNIPVESMVKYANDAAKEKFENIYNSKDYNTEGFFAEKIVPISNYYAVGIKEPSIYNYLIENNMRDTAFANKYRDVMNILPYIGDMYAIDYANKTYRPIAYKTYPSNSDKTLKSKVVTYAAIISKLSPDEYSNFIGTIGAMLNRDENVSYIFPETTCPKCGTVIPATPQQPSDMVFTRHRLGAIQSI